MQLKAVILAGGLGTRMREQSEHRPKPMVEIGGKPVLWHIMKNFSHYGITDFIILGGYKVDVIKDFVLNIGPKTDDFTISRQGIRLLGNDRTLSGDWSITVLDTGLTTLTAGRLLKARDLLEGEPFLCTYGDGLADVNVEGLIQKFNSGSNQSLMTVYQPESRFGVVNFDEASQVTAFVEKPKMAEWINIGYFLFGPEIWSVIEGDEPLEQAPLVKLTDYGKLRVNRHSGFWLPMDTYREYQVLRDLWERGDAPWATWIQ